ncbi:MAG: hypothetical protein L7F77_07480 [Candidatus Magnetominusculus sp. LBB02]|nr:hypothetical protein [Candidatus Magnetominusculus sp. LBB02]
MRKTLIALAMACMLIIPAYAAADNLGQQGPGPQGQGQWPGKQGQGNIEGKKAEILQNIDRRLNHLQGLKSCVQAAKVHSDLKACHDKFPPLDAPKK